MEFTVTNTGERRPLTQKVSVSVDDSAPPQHIGEEMFQRRYKLEIKVAYNFWSNEAQLPQKTALAEKAARSFLFQEMLPIVDQISAETNDREVFELAGLLRKKMMGEG